MPEARDHTPLDIDASNSPLVAAIVRGGDCVFQTDADGVITSWNAGAAEVFGYEAGQIVGRSWRLLIDESNDVIGPDAASPQSAETAPTRKLVARRGDGTRLPLVVTTVPVVGADRVVGFVRVVRTEQGAGAADPEARRLTAIVDASDDAIVGKDLNGIVRSWNRSAERMFGYTAAEMIGQSIRRIIPADRQYEEDDVLARIRRGDKVDHFETIRQHKDGTLLPISLSVSPITDEQGRVIGASKIARDIRDRKRLAAIVDSSDDAIVGKTLDGIVTSWNAAAERMFGFAARDIVGTSIRRIIPSDRQHEEDEVLARIRRGEKVDHFETIRQRKDGTLVPISLTVSPIRDERGTVVGASKIARDISDRKRADDERTRLLALAERNAAITDKLNRVGTIVASTLDRDAVVQAVTDAATELTGAQFGAFFYNVVNEQGESYTLYTISGVPRDRFSQFPMPRNTTLFDPTFKGTYVVRCDDVTTDPRYGRNAPYHGMPPGHLPVRSYLAVPVRSSSGEVLGGLFFGHGETGRFTQEHESLVVGIAAWASVALENARLYRGLQEANRLKDEFLATLSHELRTPLNAILGYARMLRAGVVGPVQQPRAVETIERNAVSLTQIVEDVLDISRIVAGKMRLNIQTIDLAEPVRRAAESIRPSADVKGIKLDVDSPRALPLVAADAERVQQIAWNLLSNAVKFTPRGGRIQVRLEAHAGGVSVVVADNGVGIDRAFLPFVFDRFRQGDAGSTRVFGGLGLGLSIVRQLVDMHGATVTAASDGIGKGAAFTVTFPSINHPPHGVDAGVHATETADGPVALADLRGLRMLAVDDELDALAMVRDILEAAGAEVISARSAGEALEALGSARVDAVVADLAMPHVDGFALITQIRHHADEAVRTVPAVALTAYARSEDRARALSAGYQRHLAKPIDPAELVRVLRVLCSPTS